MAALVNRQYEPMAGPEGSTIDVPIPSAIAVRDVTPAATAPATPDIGPTSVPIVLDRWKEAEFQMSDKQLLEVQANTIPMQASEAVKVLANELNQYILGLASKFYGVFGTAGTTPFADVLTTDASGSRTVLNNQVAPLGDRFMVLDPDAEGAALNVRAFHDASFGVGGGAILDGQIFRRIGWGWFLSQNVQTHIAGTGTSYLVNSTPSLAIGVKVIPADGGSGTIIVGDIVTFAGDAQTYVVTSALSGGSFSIEPGLVLALANNTAITLKATHVMNMGAHRDAIALATRPLLRSTLQQTIIESNFDPKSQLTLRLEIVRQHRRDKWGWDILYGGEVIRRELGMRLFG